MATADDVIIGRIRKLIALTDSDKEGEANNAHAKAIELLDKHGLEYDTDDDGRIAPKFDEDLTACYQRLQE